MKKILILAREPETFAKLAQSLTTDAAEVEVATYSDLVFWIDDDEAKVFCYKTGKDLREYQRILVLSTSPYHKQNYIFSALACYCRHYGIELLDDSFTNTDGKLYAMWRFWEQGVKVPRTAFGPVGFLAETLPKLGGIGVLKSVNGTKGRDNYLVRSAEEIRKIIAENPETYFTLQNFIPNDGDYRVVLLNFEPKLVIYRSANGKDFRNNTSLGGQASLVALTEVDPKVLDLAVKAAKALNIRIAGADILQDKTTGEYSVLEVNRTPQLASGAFVDEKMQILKELAQ